MASMKDTSDVAAVAGLTGTASTRLSHQPEEAV